MRNFLFLFCLLIVSSSAQAKCTGVFDFRWVQESNATQTTDNGKCNINLRNSASPVYGTEIINQPKSGRVTIEGRTTVHYEAKPGFHGTDSFTFQWIGKKRGTTPSAATVNINIVVK